MLPCNRPHLAFSSLERNEIGLFVYLALFRHTPVTALASFTKHQDHINLSVICNYHTPGNIYSEIYSYSSTVGKLHAFVTEILVT